MRSVRGVAQRKKDGQTDEMTDGQRDYYMPLFKGHKKQ